MTAGRHIVLEAVAGEYLDRLAKRAENLPVGNPHTEQVALGPLINERQLANVDRIVTETVASGATVRGRHARAAVLPADRARRRHAGHGGLPRGDLRAGRAGSRREGRGRGRPDRERHEYGLVAAIQTGSMERGLEIADRLNTGIVHVNDQTLNNDVYAPFGGTGSSGNGSRFGSQSSWDEFTQWQWVTARPQAHGFPF
jgi:benzaldehyde dehydrogenase (NAD)